MRLTPEQRLEFVAVTDAVMKWINDNGHPHMKVIVDTTTVELVEAVESYMTFTHIRD